MSNLKGLEDELRAEMSKTNVVHIKQRLSQDQTQDLPRENAGSKAGEESSI